MRWRITRRQLHSTWSEEDREGLQLLMKMLEGRKADRLDDLIEERWLPLYVLAQWYYIAYKTTWANDILQQAKNLVTNEKIAFLAKKCWSAVAAGLPQSEKLKDNQEIWSEDVLNSALVFVGETLVTAQDWDSIWDLKFGVWEDRLKFRPVSYLTLNLLALYHTTQWGWIQLKIGTEATDEPDAKSVDG